MGSRRKARECALQMLFAADVAGTRSDELARTFWSELADGDLDPPSLVYALLFTHPTPPERIAAVRATMAR